MEQTDNDAWDEGVTASEDSGDDGRPTGEEDGEYKDDKSHNTFEFDTRDFCVHFTHFL